MSKFDAVLKAKRGEPEPDPNPSGTRSAQAPLPSPAPVETPRRGRPPGKRSDPGFSQVTAYIPSDLHHNVKLTLLQEHKGREFSELVGELLAEWLKSRT